jgi:hypothetical protein
MTRIRVQPPYMSVYSEQIATMADDIRQAAMTLTGQLGVLGDYCGTDEDAMAFKAMYDPALHGAEDAMNTTVVDRLTTMSQVLKEMSGRFAEEDAATAAALRRASPADHFGG